MGNSRYVGETEQALHQRMNSHRSDIRKKTKEKPVAAHFCSGGHALSDFNVVVVDQLHQGDPVLRKNTEKQGGKMDSPPENSTARGYEH